jgi:uncharacterized protein
MTILAEFARRLQHAPQAVLLGLVRGYRLLLKPWLGNACRFEPTCSAYALEALQDHGALKGATLSAARVLRCHPWCEGGLDPVPDRFTVPGAGLFSRLGLPRGDDTTKTRNPS